MYNKEIISNVKKYKDDNPTKTISEISRIFGVSRATVKDWTVCRRYKKTLSKLTNEDFFNDFLEKLKTNTEYNNMYYYLLGQYLGDGYINEMPNRKTYCLRISEADTYPGIKEETIKALNTIFPKNKVLRRKNQGCESIGIYNCELPNIFPHCGIGKKHDRKIEFCDWQIANMNYRYLIKGLFHSDGCYYKDYRSWITNDGVRKEKFYNYYNFANCSVDLIQFFCDGLDNYNIKYRIVDRTNKNPNHAEAKIVVVSKIEQVKSLYNLIGEKY